MEFFYYSRQWTGNTYQRLLRFFRILFFELRRIFTKKIYIAEFDLSDECNLRCTHCYHFRAKKKHNLNNITANRWENKFKELYSKGIRRVLLIGGEPAVRMDVIKLASEIFPYIDICSNGTIKIGEFYNQKIFVSIDGDRETHDKIRGRGIFDRIISNYAGDKRVVISMTITKDNYLKAEEVVKLAIDHNMKGVSCDIYTPAPGNADNDEMFIDDEVRKEIISELRRLKRKYPRHFFMSNKSIDWYENPNHEVTSCYWRSAVIHFDTQLKEKQACDYYDCSNCGHFAGANLSPLNFLIKKNDKT